MKMCFLHILKRDVKMWLLNIIFVLVFCSSTCHGDLPIELATGANASLPSPTSMCNNKSSPSATPTSRVLQFRTPFMDMEMQNQRNVHIIQEQIGRQLYVLHGNELYRLFVSRDEKRLSLVALLNGIVQGEEPLGAQMIAWYNYLLLVIAMEEHLEIYQLPAAQLEQNAVLASQGKLNKEQTSLYEPIQQLTLSGRYQQVFLISPAEQQVLLIVAVNFTKLHGKLRTFEWTSSYFDQIEELTLPPMHVLSVIGAASHKYLVTGRIVKHQSKTVLNIFEVQPTDMHLRKTQTLTVSSRSVHAATYHNKNYLIACSKAQKKCNSFRMSEGVFNPYKQRPSEELTFDKFSAGTHFLVGARLNEVLLYTNAHLDCYASFTTNETDITSIILYRNEHDEQYILLSYKRPFHTLMRMIEVETEKGQLLGSMTNETDTEDIGQLRTHQHLFEDTIMQLRSLLLRRKRVMDVFRKVLAFTKPRLHKLQVQYPVHVHEGKIGLVKVVGKNLRSPLQLLKRVEEMKATYRRTRFVRSSDQPEMFTLELPTHLKARKLHVHNLKYNGSLIEGFHLENSSTHSPIISIRPPITTKRLNAQHLLTHQRLRGRRQPGSDLATFKARELFVERINDVPVATFFETLFMKQRHTKIQGRLILQAESIVTNLETPLLNGLVVSQLFNLRKPQVVNANILFQGIVVNELKAASVNGLNFAEDIVFSGRDDVVETPVDIQEMDVTGDLFLAFTPKLERDANTDFGPLQQFYTGKVIIKGSLTVDNLETMPNNAEVALEGLTFSEASLRNDYLLQNTPQHFDMPVTFGNAKVTTPFLNTNYLNGHPTKDHLLTTGHGSLQKPLLLIFFNVTAKGDISCPGYKSKLAELNTEAVRIGEIANITGMKVFTAPLTTDHLITMQLNQLPVKELVLKSQLEKEFKFDGNKSFEKLVVMDKMSVEKELNSTYLNNKPLKELFNYDTYLKNLQVPFKLETSNLVFQNLNGMPFGQIFANFNEGDQELVLHKDLVIEGNVRFVEDLRVKYINELAWKEYVDSLVRLNENALIYGEKQFLNGLVITSQLKTPTLNGVHMEEVFENILRKSKPQLITGFYTFDQLELSNVDVSKINEVPTDSFIDTRSPNIVIDGDLVVSKLSVHGNLHTGMSQRFPFDDLPARLQALTIRPWRNLVVLGNAYLNESQLYDRTQHEHLQYLYKNAVRRGGNQVISGNVRLRRPLITHMQTKGPFPKGIDLDFIARDCLLKNTTMRQVISGYKTFLRPVQMQRVEAQLGVYSPLVNKIDVARLNSSLYRFSSGLPIKGPLYFKVPPIVGHLVVQGLVNGISPSYIYHGGNVLMPPVKLHNLIVENALQLQHINDMSLDYLLENRVTLTGPALEVFGFLRFEQLVLNEKILLQSINGIPIDSLVFTKSKQLQTITAPKYIEGELQLTGPAHVLNLNGHYLLDTYQQSVFTTGNYQFDSLAIDEGTFTKGMVLVNNLLQPEGARVGDSLEESTSSPTQSHLNEVIEDFEPASPHNPKNDNKFLIYLDFDFNTEVMNTRPNESAHDPELHELQPPTMCEHRYLQVQQSIVNRRIFVTNVTTNFVTAQSGGLFVKAQNFCDGRFTKIKSKITLEGPNISKAFGMKKFIESIEIYVQNETQMFLLLHAIDPSRDRNEVRVLKIDDEHIHDWQSVRLGVGRRMRLFKFPGHVALLSSTWLNQREVLTIYYFMHEKQLFKLTQIIDGEFDMMEILPVREGIHQLIMACRECQSIEIHERETEGEWNAPFKLKQMLRLPINIDKLYPFKLSDGSFYLLVLGTEDHDFYHLYKYAHIQGWVHKTYGYFKNIEMAVPLKGEMLEPVGNNLLLLLCGGEKEEGATEGDKCSLVRAIVQ